MSHEVDRAYYQRCAEKEREKAAKNSDLAIRRTHERLAELYESKAARMQAGIMARSRVTNGGGRDPVK